MTRVLLQRFCLICRQPRGLLEGRSVYVQRFQTMNHFPLLFLFAFGSFFRSFGKNVAAQDDDIVQVAVVRVLFDLGHASSFRCFCISFSLGALVFFRIAVFR